MSPQLIVIDTPEGIKELTQYLADKDIVAFDVETTGLTKRDTVIGYSVCAEEDKAYYVILSKWQTDLTALNPIPGMLLPTLDLLASLKGKKLIMHNGVFDCMMTEANFKASLIEDLHTCTMTLAHLLDENRPIGLKPLTAKLFGANVDAEKREMDASIIANGGSATKDNYELYKADAYLIGKYGAKDAWLTYKLFLELVPQLYEQGLDKFFYEEESMPLLRTATYELNTTGLQVDTQKMSELKTTLQAECAEAKAFIHGETVAHTKAKFPGTNKKNTFNFGSNAQLAWLLFGQLEFEFNTLTKGGKTICKALGLRLPYTAPAKRDFIQLCLNAVGQIYEPGAIINGKKRKAKTIKEPWAYISAGKKTLQKAAPRFKWVAELLEYKRKDKLLKTYIAGIEERVQYGILNPSFLQTGTKTGRYSSKQPNLQNLPRNDKRIKSCFIARPGKVFVGADYSQLEPRVFAYYSQDKRLMAAFDGTSDFYSVVGCETFDITDAEPQKDGPNAFGVKYKELRDDSKVFALATAYGATPPQLAPMLKKTRDETAELMNKYLENFLGVQTMMLEAHDLVKAQGFVTNLYGRPRRLPDALKITKLYGNTAHWELPYDARKLLNMACNHRIQGTGGSIINRASIQYCINRDKLGLKAPIVCQVHDFLAVECNESDAETVALILQDALETTNTLPGVPLEAIPKVGRTLADV